VSVAVARHDAARSTDGDTRPRAGRVGERARLGLGAVAAGVLGAAPHVLHHVGPLAGAALFAGAGGQLLFAALGFALAIPLLVKLRRRTGSWRVPAGALVVMASVFALSTAVIAPALTASNDDTRQETPAEPAPAPGAHEEHH
jgi:hypothetical protein